MNEYSGEVVAGHPDDVAMLDQVQAAQPRIEPSRVHLSKHLPRGVAYLINLDKLNEMIEESLRSMRFFP